MGDSESRAPRLIALFLLGCLLFNYPILALFNVPRRAAGPGALHLPFLRLGVAHRDGGDRRSNGATRRAGPQCSRAGYRRLCPSPISGCCSRSRGSRTGAPPRAARSSPTRRSTAFRSRSTPPRGPSTAAWGARRPTASGFLPIYIGPTLMIALWWFVLRKMLRIAKLNRITSLADFVASRYGKSALLGGPSRSSR